MDKITQLMKEHYGKTFNKYGCSSEGVDWGKHEERALLRHQKIYEVIEKKPCSILDVGCGYGAFIDYIGEKNINFTGIDCVGSMIATAQQKYPNSAFICDDFLRHDFKDKKFDYVVCNGILTQKLTASDNDMESFSHDVIAKMFSICNKGIVFNMMTSHVNFKADNLFYKDPVDMLSWVMKNITKNVKLDHAYPLYEYMIYAYN